MSKIAQCGRRNYWTLWYTNETPGGHRRGAEKKANRQHSPRFHQSAREATHNWQNQANGKSADPPSMTQQQEFREVVIKRAKQHRKNSKMQQQRCILDIDGSNDNSCVREKEEKQTMARDSFYQAEQKQIFRRSSSRNMEQSSTGKRYGKSQI